MTTEQTAITQYKNNSIIRSYDDAERAAKAMATSGYFQDAHQAAQAVVKILAGQEMGFGPFASMTGIYIIQNRPSIGANLMAAAVKKSGRYNYRVVEMTEKTCSIDFYEGAEKIGNSTFTIEDAKKAGTKNIDRYPRNMLFARAISNGVRWFCPDVFNGSPVYTPEELGAEVNEDGEVINAQFTTVPERDIDELTAAFETVSSMGKLGDLTMDQLYEQRKAAAAVPERNRTEKYKKAAAALELVIKSREEDARIDAEQENATEPA